MTAGDSLRTISQRRQVSERLHALRTRDTDGEVRLEGVVTSHVVWRDIPLDRGSGRWLLS